MGSEEKYLDDLLKSVMGEPVTQENNVQEPEEEIIPETSVVPEQGDEIVQKDEMAALLDAAIDGIPEEETLVIPEEVVIMPEEPIVLPTEPSPFLQEQESEEMTEADISALLDMVDALPEDEILAMSAEEPMIVPEETLVIPEEPMIVPEETLVIPEEPMIVPEEPVIIPEEEPVAISETPAAADNPSAMMSADEIAAMFAAAEAVTAEEPEPAPMPEEPIVLPTEPSPFLQEQESEEMTEADISALLDMVNALPEDEILAMSAEEPMIVPEETLVIPEEPMIIPEEPVIIPEEPELTPVAEEPMIIPEEMPAVSDDDISALLDAALENVSAEEMNFVQGDAAASPDSDMLSSLSDDSLVFDSIASLTEEEIGNMLQSAADVSGDTPEIPDISEDESAADLFDMLQKSDEHELIDEKQIALSEELDSLSLQNDTFDAADTQNMSVNDMAELLGSLSGGALLDADAGKTEKARKKAEKAEKKRLEKERKKQEKEEKKAAGGGSFFARFKKKPKEDASDPAFVDLNNNEVDDAFEDSIKELLVDDLPDLSDGVDGVSANAEESAEEPMVLDDSLDTGEESALGMSDEDAISLGEAFDLPEETMALLSGSDPGASSDEPLALSEAEATLALRDRNETDSEEPVQTKKKGFFSRLMDMLFESDDEEEESQELPTGKVSEENQTILDALDAEDEKKAGKGKKEKKKKEKKKKKGEEGEEGEDAKDKKKKKEKVKKEKKKKEPVDEPPQKKLPKKKVKAAILFSATILAVLLIFGLLVPSILSVKQARDAYSAGKYETAYMNFYGKKLNDKDKEMMEKTEIILKVQRKWKLYKNFMQADKPLEALDALMQGVNKYHQLENKIEELGISGKVGKYYKKMINVLHKDYNVSEEEAIMITELEDDRDYTKALHNILGGLKYDAVSDTDYREELEPLEDDISEEELEELTEPEPKEQGNVLFEIFAK